MVRTGLSLIEVLMSIFVVSLGLLGVASLLPVAYQEAQQGSLNDAIGMFGKEKHRDFFVRGINQPANWLYSNGTNVYDTNTGMWRQFNGDQQPIQIPQPVAIDPRFVARRQGTDLVFPLAGGYGAKMKRISLSTYPAGNIVMSPLQADEIFMSEDDLEFEKSGNPDEPPLQRYWQDAGNNTNHKRFSNGRYSWMATVVPTTISDDLFTLSVVVFYQRDSSFDLNPASNPDERTMIINFVGGGWGGGDVTIRSAIESDLETSAGQWLMVANDNVFRWYHIAKVGGDVYENPPSIFNRDLTLAGSDWNAVLAPNAQATIMPAVVAVYEKSLRLENGSLWSN